MWWTAGRVRQLLTLAARTPVNHTTPHRAAAQHTSHNHLCSVSLFQHHHLLSPSPARTTTQLDANPLATRHINPRAARVWVLPVALFGLDYIHNMKEAPKIDFDLRHRPLLKGMFWGGPDSWMILNCC